MHGDWTQLFLFVASDKPTFFAAGEDVPDCTEDAGGGKHQTLYRKPIAHPFGYHFFRGNYIKRDGQMKPSTVPAALHTPPAKLWGKDVQRGVSLMAIQDDYKLSRVEKLLFPLVRWYDLKFIPKLRSLLPKRFRTSALY